MSDFHMFGWVGGGTHMHNIDKGGTPRVSSTVAFISRHATSNLARGRGSTSHINPSSLYIVVPYVTVEAGPRR